MPTFVLKANAVSKPKKEEDFASDFITHLYGCKTVEQNEGQVLVTTDPQEGDQRIVSNGYENGFINAIHLAYSEHRHLVLRPDDVWLAITTALGLYVNKHSEEMRHAFVDHEGKIELEVTGGGSIDTADWNNLIHQMSNQIEKNSKGDVRSWIEPNFSTTTPTIKTVGQVVLMGVMKNYYDYGVCLACGIPKVTLQGDLNDWEELRKKADHLKSFGVDCLTHWAGLLDPILSQFVESYKGNVDVDFWSRICHREGWGSGPRYLCGWVNVFIPFGHTDGEYKLLDAKPEENNWCQIDTNEVPASTTEVPVLINDNGREYSTVFFGGHIVCLYDESDDSVRPSLDWAIVDITEISKMQKDPEQLRMERFEEMLEIEDYEEAYKWENFSKPVIYKYGIQ